MRPLRVMLPAAAIAAAAGHALAQDTAAGLAAWDRLYAVFSHPRCANCHVPDDRPRWSGAHYGATRVHGFNVQRGESNIGKPGMHCPTCHFSTNSSVLHGPPGAVDWQLAPVEMAWWEKSSADICAQVKDPARNNNMSPEKLVEHIKTPLVEWGWAPGPGREPAPGSVEETYAAMVAWTGAGMPCPER
jgi:hypothetical protein